MDFLADPSDHSIDELWGMDEEVKGYIWSDMYALYGQFDLYATFEEPGAAEMHRLRANRLFDRLMLEPKSVLRAIMFFMRDEDDRAQSKRLSDASKKADTTRTWSAWLGWDMAHEQGVRLQQRLDEYVAMQFYVKTDGKADQDYPEPWHPTHQGVFEVAPKTRRTITPEEREQLRALARMNAQPRADETKF